MKPGQCGPRKTWTFTLLVSIWFLPSSETESNRKLGPSQSLQYRGRISSAKCPRGQKNKTECRGPQGLEHYKPIITDAPITGVWLGNRQEHQESQNVNRNKGGHHLCCVCYIHLLICYALVHICACRVQMNMCSYPRMSMPCTYMCAH